MAKTHSKGVSRSIPFDFSHNIHTRDRRDRLVARTIEIALPWALVALVVVGADLLLVRYAS
jgi:hypothetical protein